MVHKLFYMILELETFKDLELPILIIVLLIFMIYHFRAIENGDTEKDIPEEMRKILNQTLGQDDGLSRVKSGMSVKSATTLSREDDR